MKPNKVGVAVLIALLGAATFAGNAVAQDHKHGAEGGMMQGVDHDQMMEDMNHGGMTGDERARSHGEPDTHGAEASNSPATEAYRATNATSS